MASAIIVEDSWRGRGEEVIDRALGGPWSRPWAIYCNLTSLRTKTATVSSFAYSPSPYITRSVFFSPHPLLLKQLCAHVGWQMCFYLQLNTEDFSGLVHLIIKKANKKNRQPFNPQTRFHVINFESNLLTYWLCSILHWGLSHHGGFCFRKKWSKKGKLAVSSLWYLSCTDPFFYFFYIYHFIFWNKF